MVYEITVEDPAPGFTQLRQVTDVQVAGWVGGWVYSCFLSHSYSPTHPLTYSQDMAKQKDELFPSSLLDKSQFTCIGQEEIKAVQGKMKVTKQQVLLAYECIKLLQVLGGGRGGGDKGGKDEAPSKGGGGKKKEEEEEEKIQAQFRLMIKRRLAKEVQGEYLNRKVRQPTHPPTHPPLHLLTPSLIHPPTHPQEELQVYLTKAFDARLEELKTIVRKAGMWVEEEEEEEEEEEDGRE